jgi:SAM-dependent methyltransferase
MGRYVSRVREQMRLRGWTAPLVSREYDVMADRVATAHHEHVLDWGAGPGQLTARLARRGVNVTAYEYRPGAPAGTTAFQDFPGLVYDHSQSPVELPYPDGTFDAVISAGVLEHVADPNGSLRELHRVLAAGGLLYVYKLPYRFSYLEWIARRLGRFGLYYHGKFPDDRLYSMRSADALVTAHGFTVQECRRANLLPLTVPTPARRRVSDLLWHLNRALGRTPLVAFATNVELIASRRP